MTPEDKAKLDNLYELVRENNALLRSLQRSSRLRTTLRVIYWIIIIGLSFGAFYFIQPYVDFLKNGFGGSSSNNNQNYAEQIRDLLQ